MVISSRERLLTILSDVLKKYDFIIPHPIYGNYFVGSGRSVKSKEIRFSDWEGKKKRILAHIVNLM